jgi:hypothetical protein
MNRVAPSCGAHRFTWNIAHKRKIANLGIIALATNLTLILHIFLVIPCEVKYYEFVPDLLLWIVFEEIRKF